MRLRVNRCSPRANLPGISPPPPYPPIVRQRGPGPPRPGPLFLNRLGLRRAGESDASPQIALRIDRLAGEPYLVMQVRTGGAAAGADTTDRVAGLDDLSFAHLDD